MTKFKKGPKWDGDFERWSKLLTSWLRLSDKDVTNGEIVAAIIVGLSESPRLKNGDNVVDIILELEDTELYPEQDTPKLEGEKQTDLKNGVVQMKDELRKSDGLANIYRTLQAKYGEREETKLFSWYEEFESLKKTKEESMNDFVIRFERLYKKLERNDVKLPDLIQAFRLLKSADLGRSEMMVKMGVGPEKMTYQKMKSCLLAYADGVVQTNEHQKIMPKIKLIKEEPQEVLYQEEQSDSEYNDEDKGDFEFHDYEEDSEHNNMDELYFQRRTPYNNTRQYNQGQRFKRPSNNSQNRGQYNRRTESGKTSTCRICQSVMHWAKDCQHNHERKNRDYKKPEAVLKLDCMFIDHEELSYMTSEAKNIALLDCGAAKTVVGKQWYNDFENSLSPDEKSKIREEKNTNLFKFGDGETIHSSLVKVIPLNICGQQMQIKANVVENNVPLLISNHSLKAAKAKINFVHDTIEIEGQEQKLISTSSGHYGVPVGKHCEESDCKVFLETATTKDPKKIALHLHRYFAHASAQKIKDFVQKSNHELKAEIAKEIDLISCDICKKNKRGVPIPNTCLPMAEEFNETVALDLKFMDEVIILHCIDLLSRFSTAIVVKNKTKEVIVEAFMRTWISIFGIPQKTLCDNGKEFCNKDFLDMCQNLNIDMKTTAAFSPYSNGVVERHNGILADMTQKIKEDTRCSTEIALCWALQAKNSMSNVYGFSPMQLVFGYNPKIPGLDEGNINLGQIGGVTSSKIVADNINAMYEARRAFLSAQASDRMTRALKGRVFKAYETNYFPGDKVYYRTKGTTWFGPGIVIGQYKKLVLVKHGGSFVRVHPSKLVLQTTADKSINSDTPIVITKDNEENNDYNHSTPTNQRVESSDDSSEDEDIETLTTLQRTEPVQDKVTAGDNHPETETSAIELDKQLDGSRNATENWVSVNKDEKKDRYLLNTGDSIRYKKTEEEPWTDAVVLGPAGTARGVNKNRYNVQSSTGNDFSIHADRMDKLEKQILFNMEWSMEENEENIIFSQFPDQEMLESIKKAKENEIKNFQEFEVYDEVAIEDIDHEAQVVSSRWVIQKKPDGKVKARIVARGFEEGENLASDAPTVDKTSQRLFTAISCMKGWNVHSLDIKSAFLQSHKMKRKVYLKPPADIKKKDIVWKVKKPVYGLKDSALNWFKTVEHDLLELNCTQSVLDPAFFSFYSHDKILIGMLVSHVDDFLYSGTKKFHETVIQTVKEKYSISSQNDGSFEYVGIYIDQNEDRIRIDQNSFVDKIKPINLTADALKDNNRNLNEDEKKMYQQLLGKINWICHQSRPDLSFEAYCASLHSQAPTVQNLKKLNKVVGRLKDGLKHIQYPKLDEESLHIRCFSDASFANLPDKVSSGEGFVVFLTDQYGQASLLNWKSKKATRVVHSTLAAECLSLVDCHGDASYIRNIMEEIMFQNAKSKKIPITIYTDSIQLRKALYSNHLVTEKLLRITIAEMKQIVQDKTEKVCVRWVKSANMLSDSLTKNGASTQKLCQVLEESYMDIEELEKDENEKIGLPQNV